MRERRENERLEREVHRERVQREREGIGSCSVESETRGSRCVYVTNAGFKTRV